MNFFPPGEGLISICLSFASCTIRTPSGVIRYRTTRDFGRGATTPNLPDSRHAQSSATAGAICQICFRRLKMYGHLAPVTHEKLMCGSERDLFPYTNSLLTFFTASGFIVDDVWWIAMTGAGVDSRKVACIADQGLQLERNIIGRALCTYAAYGVLMALAIKITGNAPKGMKR